ncbi:hypothetical protein GOZ84_13485 [Agrobacterium vitis]|uniref:hypothetical protein n=1 Tax=Rhizobium/Agrobacterium group TaxID=227290 RepID=UPI0012E74F97|nr:MULTISPECIES: hypothetical protein [Rhizobium/Agrobacterium group]MCF1446351.1 hypothetical protein [Allorhizobium ampelinum]MCF1492767.1 hypothetical protein [Allorhizobium ampelinum]MVA45563.1 hypothetical protein [Agrobacterium vitis]MVA51808.1 hypothetical protein [Agrobacterium vitis]
MNDIEFIETAKPEPVGSGFEYREQAEAHAGRRDSNASSVGAVIMEHWSFRVEVALVSMIGKLTMAKNEKTSSSVASAASKLLSNPKTPANVKMVAASALTQATDKKKK